MFEWRLWQVYRWCLQTIWFQSKKKLLERGRAAKDNAGKLQNEIKTINSVIAYLIYSK